MRKFIFMVVLMSILNISYSKWDVCKNVKTGTFYSFVEHGVILAGGIGVFISSDNGVSFERTNNILSNRTIYSLAVKDNYIFAGTDKGLYSSIDTGKTWNLIEFDNKPVKSLFVNDDRIFVGIIGEDIYFSNNNGKNWYDSNIIQKIKLINSFIKTNNYILAAGEGFYISSDNGNSWLNRSYGSFQRSTSMTSIGDLIFLEYITGYYFTSDYGINWKYKDFSSDNTFIYSIIAIDSILIAGSENDMFLSNDKGLSWNTIGDGLDSASKILALWNKKQYLFAGTSKGIYRANLSDFGISNVKDEAKISITISPNPASDFIEINVEVNGGLNGEIGIYDVYGRKVNLTPTLSEGEGVRIDVSKLVPGLYFVRIGSEVRKLVKL